MRDIATATLSGNLTRDAELRELPSGGEAARLRVATATRGRNGEEWVNRTNYFTVEVYGAQARACAEYLRKGSRVLVDAELDWREWTDQQQNSREAVTFSCSRALARELTPAMRAGSATSRALRPPSASRRPRPLGHPLAPTICRSESTSAAGSRAPFFALVVDPARAVGRRILVIGAREEARPASCGGGLSWR